MRLQLQSRCGAVPFVRACNASGQAMKTARTSSQRHVTSRGNSPLTNGRSAFAAIHAYMRRVSMQSEASRSSAVRDQRKEIKARSNGFCGF